MKQWIDDYWEGDALKALCEYGTIPNVSPAYDATWRESGHMARAARLLADWARSRDIRGAHVSLLEDPLRTPLIFIEIEGQRDETVLMYGHLDKQPPMLPWREGLHPWKPVREGDLLYGRGLADDGYAIFAALGAVEAAQKNGASLPRVCIMIEASEESGSHDLEYYVARLSKTIGTPSVVLTLDAEDRDQQRFWLTQSLRGIVVGTLTVETIPAPMHSGLATGVVPSAFRILRSVLARLEDPQSGHIANTVLNPPLSPEQHVYLTRIALDNPDYLRSFDLPAHLQPNAASQEQVIEDNLLRAGLEVTGITGLPQADLAGNVMVGTISVRISLRIPPDVDPEAAAREVTRILTTDPPYGARITFMVTTANWGWLAKPLSEKLKSRLQRAAFTAYGREVGFIGIGSSIPFVQAMVTQFPEAEHILAGILSPSSRAHGANENMSIEKVKRLTHCIALFLEDE